MASLATAIGFILLTANSIVAIHRSRGDSAATVFIIASYASLVLLFCSLRLFEKTLPGSPARDRGAKIGVWLTTTSLTAMFSWRVAVLVPSPVVGAGVCFMGASTVAGGFYALFLLPSSQEYTTTEDY